MIGLETGFHYFIYLYLSYQYFTIGRRKYVLFDKFNLKNYIYL